LPQQLVVWRVPIPSIVSEFDLTSVSDFIPAAKCMVDVFVVGPEQFIPA